MARRAHPTLYEDAARLRDWINFAEIADWCSELAGSIVSDEDARGSAYEKLQADLMLGDFEERGKVASCICIL